MGNFSDTTTVASSVDAKRKVKFGGMQTFRKAPKPDKYIGNEKTAIIVDAAAKFEIYKGLPVIASACSIPVYTFILPYNHFKLHVPTW